MRHGPSKFSYTVTKEHTGARLDKFLAQVTASDLDLSRRKLRELIDQGSVYLNNKCVRRLGLVLKLGAVITLYYEGPTPEVKTIVTPLARLTPEMILFEDDDLLVVNKPPGLPSQATLDRSRPHLYQAVQDYVRQTSERSDYVGMHQRLDKETSGVIFFTKNQEVNKFMADQVSNHRIKKTYLALAHRSLQSPLEKTWEVRNHLKKFKGPPMRVKSAASGGDYARTQFSVLEEFSEAVLLQAEPHTGRMHQIRVHLAEAGMPIWGDPAYADTHVRKLAPRLLLHAWKLELQLPRSLEMRTFEAPWPDDLKLCLKNLR